eukprot:1153064-Pelagomonas_calceolata.AAC.9
MGMEFVSKHIGTLVVKSQLFKLVKGMLSVTGPTNTQKDVYVKCVGMTNFGRFQILYKAFYRAKLAGSHGAITPAPTSLASELQGLLTRKTMLEKKYASKKIRLLFAGPANPRPHCS